VDALKRDVDAKFSQMVETATAQASAIDDLKFMFADYMGKSKGNMEGSPSITQSALENEDSGRGGHGGALPLKKQPRKKGQLSKKNGDKRSGKSKGHSTGAAEGDQLAPKSALTLSSDSEGAEVDLRKPPSPRWKVDVRESTPPSLPSEVNPSCAVASDNIVGEPVPHPLAIVSPDPYSASMEVKLSPAVPACSADPEPAGSLAHSGDPDDVAAEICSAIEAQEFGERRQVGESV
jgi:hypothetical protein